MPKDKTGDCQWPANDPLMIRYHDLEWGIPNHDDRMLFEYLVLDAFQAGLSWKTILHKRENFRRAFDQFDPEKITRYKEKKINLLLADAGIIRNRLKIRGTVKNAGEFLRLQQEYGSFDRYIWQFTGFKTICKGRRSMKDIDSSSPESDAMSRALRKEGFTFVGSTICYAFMQASGMINDHLVTCHRYPACSQSVQHR
ncbi:MAG TPA: DNA-3-methyladenine glycosylase I [Chitinophagaceae bacterium]|nr:DNA-3-methyladenine glycosylase I [Chitinophagaceae bacterium]